MSEQITRYIELNRDAYTREAIDQLLLGAGHSPEDIAAGWQAIEEEDARVAARASRASSGGGIGCLASVWISAVLLGLLLVSLTNAHLGPTEGYSLLAAAIPPEARPLVDATLATVNTVSVILGIGLVVATVWLLRRNWEPNSIAWVVFVAFLIWFMVVAGTCLYTPQVVREGLLTSVRAGT